ncbi:DsbA family protein [Streptomyces meridianus]|uniref:DsbA family protein n=1 Tax=Streptomyces meridianus TaxID=2938945 RepID=A0ABT0X1P9_9ACTN|nr:DsbA family protein [Streptomyces meridianus]MCM2576478.1 DsbA family protein [Streptomyces meridianus]
MSNRNSHANKQAARERLRAERERQAKRDRIRRRLLVGGSIVAVLGLAAGVGVAVSNMSDEGSGKGDNSNWTAAAKAKDFAKPANSSGPNGTTVVVGDPKAKHTMDVYEDMRCPICSQFEQANGETLIKDIKDGKYKVSFTFGTFLDGDKSQRGTGSKNALSALGAALNVSPDAFLEYKKALYSAKNHPEESVDAFSDDKHLIKIAQQVDALKGNQKFEKAVNNSTYDTWAVKMNEKFFQAKDVTGTPTIKIDGAKVTAEGGQTAPMTPEQFRTAVDKALAAKQ